MYSTLISAALFASLALTGARAADPLTINTVTLTQVRSMCGSHELASHNHVTLSAVQGRSHHLVGWSEELQPHCGRRSPTL
jgi:hypothetical protein